MGEKRKESFSILLKKTSKTYLKIKLYESSLWADQPGAEDGKYRVKVAGSWYSPRDIKYDFMTLHEVLALFRDGLLSLVDDTPKPQTKRINFPRGTRVRVPNGRTVDGVAVTDLGFVSPPCFLGADQQHYIMVNIAGRGRVPVLVNELEVV
ncbi:MAG TPA: hypothetical protein DCS48_02385 [Desulfovibrio sp.]|nr:hypothetical protein [Desulfovibrio sp.]